MAVQVELLMWTRLGGGVAVELEFEGCTGSGNDEESMCYLNGLTRGTLELETLENFARGSAINITRENVNNLAASGEKTSVLRLRLMNR